MTREKIIVGLLFIFIITIPNVNASNTYTNDDVTSSPSSYSVNTTYEAGTYIPPIEAYNVDLEWDDLHWIFIYSGDIKNPTKKVWMTKADYEAFRNGTDPNEFNLTILNNINQYKNYDEVQIMVTNHSGFAVDILASIEQKSNINYTNSAALKINNTNNSTWDDSAQISGLSHDNSSYFKIKPQASRFVNDSGTTVNVNGEVKLTFTKS